MKLNPQLKKGDRVVLIQMSDELNLVYGDMGTVKSKASFGDVIYGVDWDNGSKLHLLGDADKWMREEDFKVMTGGKQNVNENRDSNIIKRLPMIKHFNRRFLQDYLLKLRETGITNMLAAAPYLWIGRNKLEHEMKYKEIPNEESFEELLDMSDQSQSEMINGTILYLQEKGIEPDLDNINRYIKRNASEIVKHYIDVLS